MVTFQGATSPHVQRLFVSSHPSSGLPPRIYLPILAVISLIFLGIMTYFIGAGLGVTGSVFGVTAKPGAAAATQPQRQTQGSQASVEGGPPPAVMAELKSLRARIAEHPNDDVAITQLADMYLAANRYASAIPLYRRALRANPHNVAASAGLSEASDALKQSNAQ